MADGRVANIVISPGIGCTVFTNQTGKAISATFFAQGISTNTNSKATVVVAGAGMTITKQSILWQPTQCIACYSGFISDCPACRAYPDPGKMAQVYTQGVFRSNVGSGRSGTPGYTCGWSRCYCGRGWGVDNNWSYCYASCCRYLFIPGCFNTCGSCINKPCGLYCCYEQHYLSHNLCATGGVRFARPSDVFVGVGTTFTGYANPTPGTGGAPLWCLRFGTTPYQLCCSGDWPWSGSNACGGENKKEPSGPGIQTPPYLQCFHLSTQGQKCGCDCYSSKCGYEYECFVPMVYGGTEVINPAIAFTTPPLYNGEYSGFPNANGSDLCCTCNFGAMWASQITGWYPGQEGNCYDWCCAYFCGTANQCQLEQQRNEGGVCNQGLHGTHYLFTRCNTPNVLDAAKRLVSPKDDTGIGAGSTAKPFCYCGNQPAFDNTQGGNPLYLQSNCSVFGNCLNVLNWVTNANNCCNQNAPIRSSGISGSWMVDWYALTDYKNWCHCDTCVGRLTRGEPGCYQCNPLGNSNNCHCCFVNYCCMCGAATQDRCEIVCCGGTVNAAVLPERKVLAPIVAPNWFTGWRSVIPCLCIGPGNTECGRWIFNSDNQFYAASYGCNCRAYTYDADASGCYAAPMAIAQTFHMGQVFAAGTYCCCYSGIFGAARCCWACHCWYCGCCCGPCMGPPYNKPMGCCGFMMPWFVYYQCKCWMGVDSVRWRGHSSEGQPQLKLNPYGFHHGISCGLIMHYTGDMTYGIYPAAMDWLMPYCWNACGCYCCRTSSLPIRIMLGNNMSYCRADCCTGTQQAGDCRGVDQYVYCAANICEGLSNHYFSQCAGVNGMAAKCWYFSDAAGTLTCCCITSDDGGPMCAWSCINHNAAYGTELAVKYFAYNPDVDCHYFMARTSQEYANFWYQCVDKTFGPSSDATQALLDCCFYKGIKKEFFTREWCCGIFSVDCRAIMCYHEIKCQCCCSMRYDGRDQHPQYKDYPVWGSEGAEMFFSKCCNTTNNCCCCQCYEKYYNTKPCCQMKWCWQTWCQSTGSIFQTLEASGGMFCSAGDDVGGAPCWCCCRGFSGLGTVFFRKVANFPSIMTDYKYTQPRMCVGCLFRSDTSVWSLPVYNHCCFRWDAFITCDLINWNKQELNIVQTPTDQMTQVSSCQILSLENNYYCKCTDCFMAGFDRTGLLELCMSFNQYERTGLLINNGDSVYVKSNNVSAGITDCFNFQIWGYEG